MGSASWEGREEHRRGRTFLGWDAVRDVGGIVPALAQALDMDLFCLAELSAVFALGDGAALLLDLEERSLIVVAAGRAVAFYA